MFSMSFCRFMRRYAVAATLPVGRAWPRHVDIRAALRYDAAANEPRPKPESKIGAPLFMVSKENTETPHSQRTSVTPGYLDIRPTIGPDVIERAFAAHDFSSSTVPITNANMLDIPGNGDMDILHAYQSLRSHRRRRPAIPIHAWRQLLEHATRTSQEHIKDLLLRDLVDRSSSQREDCQQAILDVFDLTAHPSHPLAISHQQALDLFHALPPLTKSHPSMTVRIFEAMLDDPHFSLHIPFLRTAYRTLLVPPPTGSSTSKPPSGTRERRLRLLFRFLHKLYHPSSDPKTANLLTLEILSALGSSNCIPRPILHLTYRIMAPTVFDAATTSQSRTKTIRTGTLQLLVMASLKWGWHAQALQHLKPIIDATAIFDHLQAKDTRPSTHLGASSTSGLRHHDISPMTSNLIHQLILNLLAFPTAIDFNLASALIVAYTQLLARFPTLHPLPDILIQSYYNAAVTIESTQATILVYKHLLDVLGPSHVPPRRMATRLLHTFAHQGQKSDARTLIANVLAHDHRVQHDGTIQAADVPAMDPEFLAAVADAGDTHSLFECWLRAKEGWEGYSRVSICGSGVVVKAIVQLCGQGKDVDKPLKRRGDGVVEPMTRKEFAQLALKTFSEIQLKWPEKASEADVKAFNACCVLLGDNEKVLPLPEPNTTPTSRRSRHAAVRKADPPVVPDKAAIQAAYKQLRAAQTTSEKKAAASTVVDMILSNAPPQASPKTMPLTLSLDAARAALDAGWTRGAVTLWFCSLRFGAPHPDLDAMHTRISEAVYAQWRSGELDEENCYKILRRLKSPLLEKM